MSSTITWNQEEADSNMVIEKSDGEEIILDFDDALDNAVPAIARYMDESLMDVLHHFAYGPYSEIDDDAIEAINANR